MPKNTEAQMGFGLTEREDWEANRHEAQGAGEEDTYLVAHRINGSLASILGNA